MCALLAGGAHAEMVAAPEGQVFPAPRRVGLVEAAAIPEAFLTAFVNLAEEARLGEGETVLIHAGASGVGLAAIGLAKVRGARVAATTRAKEKLAALARAGADLAIDTSAEDFAEADGEELGPRGGGRRARSGRRRHAGGRRARCSRRGGASIFSRDDVRGARRRWTSAR